MNIRPEFLICLFLVIATLSLYWQVRHHEFIDYDDDVYVTKNPYIQKGLTWNSLAWSFTATYGANWHPLTWLSHISDIELYGLHPGRHHLSNVIFHIINSILLFLFLRNTTGAIWKSAFVAAVFALHPLHVESVAQIAERKDVLSTFFFFLTLLYYSRYAESPGIKPYLAALLFFILGLMAKPMLVTMPCVLLLLDYWPLDRLKNGIHRQVILEKIPFFIFSALSAVITVFAQKSGGAVKSLAAYPLDVRIANSLVSYMAYIEKMLWPSKLTFLYPHPGMPQIWKTAAAVMLIVCISGLVIRQTRQRPYLIAGWLWYLGTLVPVIGLVQVGLQSMADRYTYIPLIGLFIMTAWSIPDLLSETRYGNTVLAALSGVIFSLMMAITWVQTGYWNNSMKLFEQALAVTENNCMVHNNMGIILQQQGKLDGAIAHYAEALRLKPDHAGFVNNMGTALEEQGKLDEAARYYLKSLELNPGLARPHNNLAYILEKQGKADEAVRHYLEALKLNPDYTDAHINLGALLFREGKTDEAVAHFQEVLRIKGDDSAAYNNLGIASVKRGNIREAMAYFRKAVEADPANKDAYNNLKAVSAASGK